MSEYDHDKATEIHPEAVMENCDETKATYTWLGPSAASDSGPADMQSVDVPHGTYCRSTDFNTRNNTWVKSECAFAIKSAAGKGKLSYGRVL